MSGCDDFIPKIKYLFSKSFYIFSGFCIYSPLDQDVMGTEAMTLEDNSADVRLGMQFPKFLCLGKAIFREMHMRNPVVIRLTLSIFAVAYVNCV